ncbi:MAG: hypothetical protein IT201_01735 [Thermoleophilia bacterium]|nr:hypothetical protein [Thermoleophilia bacterium]
MKSTLDIEARRALLDEAATARASLEQKAAAEAATALAILLRDGLGALEQALDPSIRAELGASTRHWLDFRRTAAPTIATIAIEHGPVGAAFFLGWLKRLAMFSKPPASARPSLAPAAFRRAPASPVPRLKAGDVVEAVLLEERTKKGGWRARHVSTGLEGPIQNSDAGPAHTAPGDSLTLVIASASRTGVAFRHPAHKR